MQHKFLLNNLRLSDQLTTNLVSAGVKEQDIHFVTETFSDYSGHNIHEASIFEERDIIHSAVRLATVGALLGVMVVLAVYWLKPMGWEIQPLNIVFLMLLFVGFGGWLGGLFGINHRNYRISEHEDALRHGKAIMLVYADDEQAQRARKVVELTDAESEYLGEEMAFDNPLVSTKLAELDH